MKKIFAIVLMLALAFSLCACGSKEEVTDELLASVGKCDSVDLSNADGKLKEILDSGVLVVGTSPDYPPAEFISDDTGEVTGYEMAIAQYIANSLGVELQIEAMEFQGVLTALDTDKIDLGISGFGYKADRAESYELSIGYMTEDSEAAHHTIIIRTEDKDKYQSLDDLNSAVINAQSGSLQEMYVEDQIPGADLQLITSLDQALLNLKTGKVDAVALDKDTAENYADTSDGEFYSLYDSGIEFDLSIYPDTDGTVLAAKKGETSLIEAVNVILKDTMDKGLLDPWYEKACEMAGIEED